MDPRECAEPPRSGIGRTLTHRVAIADDLPRIQEDLDHASAVAVDTEFHAERRYSPQLHLIQLCTQQGTPWLLDPRDALVIDGLREYLPRLTWIVHGGAHDIRLLRAKLGKTPEIVVDTQIAAGFIEVPFPSPYGALVERYVGPTLAKSATMSDWSRRPLTPEQVNYAAEDVLLLPTLWERISAELRGLDRLDLALAACTEAKNHAEATEHGDLWRDIPASGTLTRQQLTVLQELLLWRDEVARVEDQPPRMVVGDGVLVDFSRRQPLTIQSMANDRRVPRQFLKRHGQEALERIERAARRPDWAWPKVVLRHTPGARLVSFLECVVEAAGARQRFAAKLVAPRTVLEDVVLAEPKTREELAATLSPWRDRLCGDLLWKALRGEVSLHASSGDIENFS